MVLTEANYRSRVKRIQEEIATRNIDAIVLGRPQSSYYVTGYNAIIYTRPIYAVLTQFGDPILVLPYLRESHAKDESPWVNDMRVYFEFPVLGRTFPTDALAALEETLAEKKVLNKTIGIEMEHISATDFSKIQRTFPDAKHVDVSTLIDEMKCVKDQDEIEAIKAACELSDIAMNEAGEALREGRTERDIFMKATQAMADEWRRQYSHLSFAGFQNESYASHMGCASGPRNQLRLGSHIPSEREVEDGDGVTVIAVPSLNCYHGELERTFLVGKPKETLVRMFKAVLEAREKAFEQMRPGATCSQIDEAARDVFKKHGMLDYIRHRSGHSIGLELHERPLLRAGDTTVLQPNMVFAVEPGLYEDGVGGVRHSDTVRVTSTGFEFLTKYDRGFLTR